MMGLHAMSIECFGFSLFGKDWRECCARALEIDEEELQGYVDDPASTPPDLAGKLKQLAAARIGEIQFSVSLLEMMGLSRDKENETRLI